MPPAPPRHLLHLIPGGLSRAPVAPQPPTAEELASLERAVRRADELLRAARTKFERELYDVQLRVLRGELNAVRGRNRLAGEVA